VIDEEIRGKKSRFSDAQILAILKQAENGVPVPELCREHGMSGASFYKWREIWRHGRFADGRDEDALRGRTSG
jgi:transposase-like protein